MISEEVLKQLIFRIVEQSEKESEVAKELGLTEDEIDWALNCAGYLACPNCSTWIESGDMRHNPEDESDYACEACSSHWGW